MSMSLIDKDSISQQLARMREEEGSELATKSERLRILSIAVRG